MFDELDVEEESLLWEHFSLVTLPAILRWQVRTNESSTDGEHNTIPAMFDTMLNMATHLHVSEVSLIIARI